MEDLHCLLALGELEVLDELVEGLEDLAVALELDIFVLELRHEALLGAHDFAGCAWLRLDLNLEGHVAPQVLELHVVVVLDVVPRHLVHLGVDTRAPLVLVGVDVAVLVLARMPLGSDIVGALESRCLVEDCGWLDDLDVRHDEECSMSVYLNRR